MNLTNNRNDILIYDKSDYLIKVVKHYCGRNIDLIFCNNSEGLSKLNLNTISIAYISSSDKCDLNEIVSIYQNIKSVYIYTLSSELKLKLGPLEGIFFFDLDTDKFKIMNQIFNSTIGFD